MTFVTDTIILRTCDQCRQLELMSTAGGCDGGQGKALIRPGFRCDFNAYLRRARREKARPLGVWRCAGLRVTVGQKIVGSAQ